MAANGPHISIKAEPVIHFYGFPITNSMIAGMIVTVLFIAIALYYSSQVHKKTKSTLFYVLQGMLEALYNLFESILGKEVNKFFSLLVAFFFFILLNNWFGLLPFVGSLLIKPVTIGPTNIVTMKQTAPKTEKTTKKAQPAEGIKPLEEEPVPVLRAATTDLNTTIALAIITVVFTQIMGFKYLGAGKHLKKYASVIGGLEAFTELSRLISFSFRLFGNIFGGEVMISIISFLIPFLTPPFFLFEVFVGFIQAFVFSMLSAVFINFAISEAH